MSTTTSVDAAVTTYTTEDFAPLLQAAFVVSPPYKLRKDQQKWSEDEKKKVESAYLSGDDYYYTKDRIIGGSTDYRQISSMTKAVNNAASTPGYTAKFENGFTKVDVFVYDCSFE
jgi:hypothetical protein